MLYNIDHTGNLNGILGIVTFELVTFSQEGSLKFKHIEILLFG